MPLNSTNESIAWFYPIMTGNELPLLEEVINSGFVNEGNQTEIFEQRIAEFTGAEYAIATNSGTVGMALALMATGIGAGDEVLVPNFTYVATANAITLTGATPVFCDVSFSDLLLDPNSLRAHLTNRTRAVLSVDVNGRGSAKPEVEEFCQKNNLVLVFDAAEALGSKLRGQRIGTFGDVSVFSLSPNKIITSGQGGVITTSNKATYKRLKQLKNQGLDRRGTGGNDDHNTLGFNFKFSDLQAAMANAQLEKIDERIAAIQKRNQEYFKQLSSVCGISLPNYDEECGTLLWPDLLCDRRDELVTKLLERGIQSRPFWKPVTAHRPYHRSAHPRTTPNTNTISKNGLWLPSAFDLTQRQISMVCQIIKEFFK